MRNLLPVCAISLALSACAGAAVPLAIGGGGSTLATIATVAATAAPLISDTAQVACAVQRVSNDLGHALPNGAAFAATVSKFAGQVCTW